MSGYCASRRTVCATYDVENTRMLHQRRPGRDLDAAWTSTLEGLLVSCDAEQLALTIAFAPA